MSKNLYDKMLDALIDDRFEACEELAKRFTGRNLFSLLLAATYVGEAQALDKRKIARMKRKKQ